MSTAIQGIAHRAPTAKVVKGIAPAKAKFVPSTPPAIANLNGPRTVPVPHRTILVAQAKPQAARIALLTKQLSSRNWRVRLKAAKALEPFLGEAASAQLALAKLLTDPVTKVREAAAYTLMRIYVFTRVKDPKVIKKFIAASGDRKSAKVRKYAVIALGYSRSKTTVPALLKRLTDKSLKVRAEAGYAIMRVTEKHLLTNKKVLPALKKLYAVKHVECRVAAVMTMGELSKGHGAVRRFVFASKPDPQIARAWARSKTYYLKAVPILTKALLNDPNQRVRFGALEALRKIRDPQSMPALGKAFNKTTSAQVRDKILKLIVSLRWPTSIPILTKVLATGKVSERKLAAKGLGEVGGRGVMMPLIKALANRVPAVKKAVVQALRQLMKSDCLSNLDRVQIKAAFRHAGVKP